MRRELTITIETDPALIASQPDLDLLVKEAGEALADLLGVVAVHALRLDGRPYVVAGDPALGRDPFDPEGGNRTPEPWPE